MKPNSIIHLVVIIIGLTALYTGLNLFTSQIYFFISQFFADGRNSYLASISTIYFLSAAISMFLGYIIIIKSKGIAEYFTMKSLITPESKLITNSREILCIFIIFLGLSHLLEYLPNLISNILDSFFNSTNNKTSYYADKNKYISTGAWITHILHVLLPCLIIIFSRSITNYFAKNLEIQSSFIVSNESSEIEKDTI